MSCREHFYMIPIQRTTHNDKKTTIQDLLNNDEKEAINNILSENIKSNVYKSHLDHIIIHKASSVIADSMFTEYITILYIRTLCEITHPLFMSCIDANKKFKFFRYHDFSSVYDITPGMRFNNEFSGNFFEQLEKL